MCPWHGQRRLTVVSAGIPAFRLPSIQEHLGVARNVAAPL